MAISDKTRSDLKSFARFVGEILLGFFVLNGIEKTFDDVTIMVTAGRHHEVQESDTRLNEEHPGNRVPNDITRFLADH